MAKQSDDASIQGAVYHELKRGIMTLQLAPGSAMSTQEMATRLNVSRTPVREAFLRLQNEGLVEAIPQKGTIVSRIDVKRVYQEHFIRTSLELAVLKPFVEQGSAVHYARLQEAVEEQKHLCAEKSYAEFVKADDAFHKILFVGAGQELAWQIIANANGHYNRMRILTVRTEEILQDTISQHENLVRLLQAKDLEGAAKALAAHVRKINGEKIGISVEEMAEKYPDYFTSGEQPEVRFVIGKL